MRVFIPPSGILRDDPEVLVTEAVIEQGFVLRHYAFAQRWFKINLILDRQGRPVEYGDDGFCLNCDLATPMLGEGGTTKAVDLFLDVLIRSDGRSARVVDADELAEAVGVGWVSEREARAARRGAQELVGLARSDRLLKLLDATCPLRPTEAAPPCPWSGHLWIQTCSPPTGPAGRWPCSGKVWSGDPARHQEVDSGPAWRPERHPGAGASWNRSVVPTGSVTSGSPLGAGGLPGPALG